MSVMIEISKINFNEVQKRGIRQSALKRLPSVGSPEWLSQLQHPEVKPAPRRLGKRIPRRIN